MQSNSRTFITDLAFALILGLYILIPVSPLITGTVSRDAGVFLYTGWRILHGEIPYVDVWDHKPPIIFYIDALGLWLGHGSVWGVWSIELIFLLAALMLSIHIVRRELKGGTPAAYAATLIWGLSIMDFLDGGNLTTEFAIPLQFLTFLLFVKLHRSKSPGWDEYLFGVVTGLMFFIRQNSIGIPLASTLILFVGLIRSPRLLARKALWMAAGFLSVCAAIFTYFYLVGGLDAMWDAAFRFNVLYAEERGWNDRLDSLKRGVLALSTTGLMQLGLLGWVGGTLILLGCFKSSDFAPPFIWLALIALPVEFAFAVWPGRERLPYYTSLMPILGLLSAISFECLQRITAAAPRWGPLLGKSIVAVVIAFVLLGASGRTTYQYTYSSDRQHERVQQFLEANTDDSDYVLVIGAETAINFATHRVSPTRFVYLYPLQRPTYADEPKLLEFYSDILDKRPKFIIATRTEEIPVSIGVKRFDTVEVAAERVAELYQLREIIIDWIVWEYIGP